MDPKSYHYWNGQEGKFIQHVLLTHMHTSFYTPYTSSISIGLCTELREITRSVYYYFSAAFTFFN